VSSHQAREVGRNAIADLTRGLACGREEAFRIFHQVYFDRLLRYLLVVTRGDEQAARDGIQETFLRVARHARRFETEAAFWSWLTVLARSAVIDAGRRQSCYQRMLFRFAGFRRAEAIPEPDSDESLLHDELANGLMTLAPLDRALMEAKYMHRRSVQELAQRFDLSPKAVESRLHRARRQLRDYLITLRKDAS